MKLSENDWLFINDLTFKIHSIPDLDEMRHTFLQLIQFLIPCEKLTFFLSNNEHYMYAPIQIGLSDSKMKWYSNEVWALDYKKWIFKTGQNKAYRMTDLFEPGVRESHPYYQNVYIPDGIHYEAILSLSYNNQFVGVVSLYRSINAENFSDKEIYILNTIKNHLAYRLYREINNQNEVSKQSKSNKLEYFVSQFNLTARESDILGCLLQGKSNPEICEELFITISTLKKHTNNIYKKLNISNRAGLFKLLD